MRLLIALFRNLVVVYHSGTFVDVFNEIVDNSVVMVATDLSIVIVVVSYSSYDIYFLMSMPLIGSLNRISLYLNFR